MAGFFIDNRKRLNKRPMMRAFLIGCRRIYFIKEIEIDIEEKDMEK